MKDDKKEGKELPKVHPELKGFDVSINELGEIVRTVDIDVINEFLSRKLYDKKLKNKTDNLPEAESEE